MDDAQVTGAAGAAPAIAVVSLALGLALVVVGAAVARRAVLAARRRRRLHADGQRVRGVVVDTQIRTRGRGDTAATGFRPVVTFTTAQGRSVTTVAGPTASAWWVERTPVDVLHDPEDPEHAEVLQPVPGTRVEGRELPTVVVGVVLVLVGLGVVVVAAAGLG
ncbi:DUF3592 domain-containing protein [Pseudokineococcus basanitobsidens]|uniref:DUF3592 domain-containing protein n=1 Tax=Pseudokineococcus basanitobsidens TaxID=1926649 RepID=A0ABU8RKM9_9ACTN